MILTAIIILCIAAIASAAIAGCAHLLDQRAQLRRILDSTRRLRVRALRQRDDDRAMYEYREARLARHCADQMRARRLVEAELAACTEAPKFGRVLRGVS